MNEYVYTRFIKKFGKTNNFIKTKIGLNFLMIDSINLDKSSNIKQYHTNVNNLIKKYSKKSIPNLILLSHIPLYKQTDSCVDQPTLVKDSNGYITQQNMLSRESSDLLLSMRPIMVFSGHGTKLS
jgi:hypothetical protein